MDETLFLRAALACYLAALAAVRWRRWAGAALGAALLLHTLSLAQRWQERGHGPFTTMYEILSSNLWSLALVVAVSAWALRELRATVLAAAPVLLVLATWLVVADDLPALLVNGAMSISGLFDMEPLRHTPFLQGDLRLTPQAVARLSPAFFPRPKGKLYAVVGAADSDEFLRQNQSIRDAWGASVVPVCETVAGTHHLDVLHALADPQARLHRLARGLLGLGGGNLR